MGSITKRLLGADAARRRHATRTRGPHERVAAVWDQFDQGTQRAILRLYRSATRDELAAAGSGWAR